LLGDAILGEHAEQDGPSAQGNNTLIDQKDGCLDKEQGSEDH
jgi:hypothetical protein